MSRDIYHIVDGDQCKVPMYMINHEDTICVSYRIIDPYPTYCYRRVYPETPDYELLVFRNPEPELLTCLKLLNIKLIIPMESHRLNKVFKKLFNTNYNKDITDSDWYGISP